MNEPYPLVSIMIPTYNRAHYLVEALESALAQDYPNLEIIVSDNASTDTTPDVMRKFLGDPRIRYYRNERNLGSGANYERLLYEHASGVYGGFLCDDDMFLNSRHISRAMGLIKAHDLKVVFSAALSRYEGGDDEGKDMSLPLPEVVPRQWWLDHLAQVKLGLTYMPSCGSGFVFLLQRGRDQGMFKKDLFYSDYEFAMRCILLDEYTGYIKEPSYLERRHPGQDGRTSYQNAIRGIMIFDHIYTYGCEIGLDPRILAKIRFRGFKLYARAYLMPNWFLEHGKSLRSFFAFFRELYRIDRYLPLALVCNPYFIAQAIFLDTAFQERLLRVFRSLRSSSVVRRVR